jgi:hypothetical protein
MARTPFDLKGKTVFVAGHGGMVVNDTLRGDLSLTTISVMWAGVLRGNPLAGQHPARKRGRSRQGA